jgi:hypothetical protein
LRPSNAPSVGLCLNELGVWILIAVLFLGGVQLVSVGILGRCLTRVHAQVLDRPLYLVDRVIRRESSGIAVGSGTEAGAGAAGMSERR